jgi:hypothetical protein
MTLLHDFLISGCVLPTILASTRPVYFIYPSLGPLPLGSHRPILHDEHEFHECRMLRAAQLRVWLIAVVGLLDLRNDHGPRAFQLAQLLLN